ncbi:unnamed protein product [Pleuronectes platessa]|uniref:Uncharacterized protein n=1 Tax=Pleuronectes platessa TaxID=8262 RepID=A0A9N7W3E6_PLEPL|nr:unnamed protein product [Pleuronectes platessa]
MRAEKRLDGATAIAVPGRCWLTRQLKSLDHAKTEAMGGRMPLISRGTRGDMQRLMQWHVTAAPVRQPPSSPLGVVYPLFIHLERKSAICIPVPRSVSNGTNDIVLGC